MTLKMNEPPEGLNGMAIAKEVLESDDEDWCGYVLWNHTGWPAFFAGDPETILRGQIAHFALAATLGLELCHLCGNNEARGGGIIPTCSECTEAMSSPSVERGTRE